MRLTKARCHRFFCLRSSALAALLCGASLAACGGPSVNQAYKSSIDQRVAALGTSPQRYEAPATTEPMPLAAGQWSRYQLVDADGHPGFITYNIVGETDGAYWLEMLQESYTTRSVILGLIDLGDRKNPASFNVKQLRTKTNDEPVNEIPESVVGLMKPLWKPLVDNLIVDWHEKPQEPAEAPAGTFDACYKVRATVDLAGSTYTSDTWSHPAVPISGAVKSQGVGNPSSMRLIEFGTTGAKSELMGGT